MSFRYLSTTRNMVVSNSIQEANFWHESRTLRNFNLCFAISSRRKGRTRARAFPHKNRLKSGGIVDKFPNSFPWNNLSAISLSRQALHITNFDFVSAMFLSCRSNRFFLARFDSFEFSIWLACIPFRFLPSCHFSLVMFTFLSFFLSVSLPLSYGFNIRRCNHSW